MNDDQDTTGAAAQAREADEPTAGEELVSFLKELPVLLLVAFLLAFLLRTFAVQVFYIPSSSMEPTLMVNDRMIVEKVTYRFREPHRGEVVVFEGETTASANGSEGLVQRFVRGTGQFLGVVPANARDFVKRVIGVPGDEVRIDDQGTVYVNGEPLEEPYIAYEDQRAYGPIVVPDGAYFFLGDNRPNSSDSRFGLGFVQEDHIVGRAVLIIWPFGHFGSVEGASYPNVPAPDGASAAALDPAA